jgi:hypothetical protein
MAGTNVDPLNNLVNNNIKKLGDITNLSRTQASGASAVASATLLTLATGTRLLGFHVQGQNTNNTNFIRLEILIDSTIVFQYRTSGASATDNRLNITEMLKGRGLAYSTNVVISVSSDSATVEDYQATLLYI